MRPLNKKLIPYSKVFKQVSKVLGREEALKQLELVWDYPECFNRFIRGEKIDLNKDLLYLFSWRDTPQDYKYWSKIQYQIQLDNE